MYALIAFKASLYFVAVFITLKFRYHIYKECHYALLVLKCHNSLHDHAFEEYDSLFYFVVLTYDDIVH